MSKQYTDASLLPQTAMRRRLCRERVDMSDKSSFSMIPIEKTDVYRTVIVRLNELIEAHQLTPGDRLPSERELSERLGVSRTTIRQGIKVLESMGKLETRVGSGTYVTAQNILVQFEMGGTTIDEKVIRDLCVSREGVELTVFREFMRGHRTKENLDSLERLLSHQEKELGKGKAVDVVYEYGFEQKVAELTQNRILMYQQKQIQKLWAYAWSQIGKVPEKRSVLHREHKTILDAIRRNDREMLGQRIAAHVNKNINPVALLSHA